MTFNINQLIRKIKIQNRLLISFAVLSLLPMLIIGIFSYYISSDAIRTKISTASIQLMYQVSENIVNELIKLENDSVDIAFSDLVQQIMGGFNTMSEWEKNVAQIKIQEMLAKRFSFFHSVSDVLVYTRNKEKVIAYGDISFKFNLKSDYLNELFEETIIKNGVPVWTIQNQDNEELARNTSSRFSNYGEAGILLSRSFKSFEGLPIGYMIMRIDVKYIFNKFRDITLGAGSHIFIVNGKGTVISSQNPQHKVATPYPDDTLIDELKQNRVTETYSFNTTIAGKRHLIAYTYIPRADWYVVSTIPFSYLDHESVKISFYILVLGISCFVLALLLSYYVSKSISSPLKCLIDSMNNVKLGNLVVQIDDRSSDELGKVTTNFNQMVSELQYLIDEVKMKEKLKRLAELKSLQAQINPHFLSNSLNTVRWLANVQKANNISNLITSLISLLHGCMGKGSELISIREEIEYVKNYLNIMAYRYYDKFMVHFEIEEDILDCHILKFALQPIVENCLLHGIEPMEGQGLIIIKGYRVQNELKITITDNGVGMDEHTLNSLLQQTTTINQSRFSGIGIRNVDERIKLYFGEKFGLSIHCVPNLFTTVEITIPTAGGEDDVKDAEGAHS
ncbi:sensor histidine kinase [Paenibacillus radicis (ex Xue et al. 2023)]|uniref:Sensor histidine kinase n=1 Tax=Paenibacillus radicis (ex Xue et al. 2023) TaxID=2972489 RepID=A0ABT1YI08_9BACL|nr:sensor histidine kinase [Paenibacillus radicis (ex Xue et al. 2023)]MCR8632830.1 sensor histidine kinase [Paenibacillus radicis (ex Xue et al. 2023)]